ncbi:caspase family protein [Segatella copri]|uniref:caspase family protein n=1 Tax=Segatella copri TaxID=165179 RepID=UPI003F6EACF5
MKKIFIAISILLLSSGSKLAAQTITESNEAYREFVQIANKDGDKTQMYDALYRCYTATYAIVTHSEKTSAEYTQAIYNMKNLIPFLPNAAAYNSNNQSVGNAIKFARAYVDVVSLPDFADGGYTTQNAYSQLSYFAAANLVNRRQYEEAIPYLQAYLRSGDEKYRKSVFMNLIKACAQSNKYQLAVITLEQASDNYPTDYDIVSSAVNLCIDHKDNANLQKFVGKGLALRPDDETLLNIQGKLYEEGHNFEQALDIYKKLQVVHPKALDVLKHLAINNYNIGVQNYNKTLELKEKDPHIKSLQETSKEYFTYAVGHLKNIIISDPLSLKYTQALAVAYNCIGDKENFNIINNKLASLGGGKIESNFIPQLIEFNGEVKPSIAAVATQQQSTDSDSQAKEEEKGIPAYSAFAIPFIENRIDKWQQKDSYETLDEYRARMTEKNRDAKIQEMQKLAQQEYISKYESRVNLRHLELKPYDADHEVFLVTSPDVGEMVVPVPRSNNEARIFASNWNGMQFKNPKYFIDKDHLALAQLTIITPSGKEYHYDNAAALNYTATNVEVHFDPINAGMLAANTNNANKQTIQQQNVKLGTSDVDENIPENPTTNNKTFAVVIANQNYTNVAGVPLALNDGLAFSKYCEKTLGMPAENVRYYADASYGTMLRAIRDIKNIASAFNGDINIVFYYAGHGIPNEATKDAYLLPTDADGTQTEGCYSLNKLYTELGSTKAKEIVVFLDACFSGSKREEGMLASARGVALKAKQEDPRGNMVVFSAASGDETAFPYSAKGHGLFTYYLLKKLQESKGDVNLGELSDYISENVKQQSVVINRKVQTPTATPSTWIATGWKEMTLKK